MAAAGQLTSDEMMARLLQEQEHAQFAERERADRELARKMHEEEGWTATDFECVICNEEFRAEELNVGVVTRCDHKFCLKCFNQWIDTKEKEINAQIARRRQSGATGGTGELISCPLCRTSIMADADRVRQRGGRPRVRLGGDAAQDGGGGGAQRAAGTRQMPDLPWDQRSTVIVTCQRCSQRLYAPRDRSVKCPCGHVTPAQPQHPRARQAPPLAPGQTLVVCPRCQNMFRANAGSTVKCTCGTDLFVPSPGQGQGQRR
eukprot:TRINITY_DN11638_c1_g1_i1.p1 TRINITY_DN11638_c1_g1~~TRINITY_DN11638_c1_g1_i1.p1  ORF type:complete len:304 (+),score=83.68 TRINITY_DN11638_c1_g1_i1:135-914(+)